MAFCLISGSVQIRFNMGSGLSFLGRPGTVLTSTKFINSYPYLLCPDLLVRNLGKLCDSDGRNAALPKGRPGTKTMSASSRALETFIKPHLGLFEMNHCLFRCLLNQDFASQRTFSFVDSAECDLW